MAHGELAEQPLLLLLLAMFEAADNGLQHSEGSLGRAPTADTENATRSAGWSA